MNPNDKPWDERQEALLGTATDAAIATRLGRTAKAVESQRRKLGVGSFKPHSRHWTAAELRLLGKVSDKQLAERLGCRRLHIVRKRQQLGIPPANPQNTPRKFRRKLAAKRRRAAV